MTGVLNDDGLTGALLVPLGLFFDFFLAGLVGAVLECALLIGVDVTSSNPEKSFLLVSLAIFSYAKSA